MTIEAMRAGLFCNTWPSWTLLLVQFVIGSIALAASISYMRRVEDRLVDVL